MHRRNVLLALAAPALFALAGGAAAQADKPIRIGMTVSSTGTFALAAQSGHRGAQIWVDDVNKRGGIDVGGAKRKVELVILDDRSDKQLVPRVYETLIKDEKVDLVFGPQTIHRLPEMIRARRATGSPACAPISKPRCPSRLRAVSAALPFAPSCTGRNTCNGIGTFANCGTPRRRTAAIG